MPTINGPMLKDLRVDINTALEAVAKKHNVSLRAGSASYDPALGTANYKLEVVALGDGGATRDMPAELFLQHAELIGLSKEHLHKTITIAGNPFKIVGYKPKARKNCILIRNPQGKQYVTDINTVKRQLVTT